MSNLGTIIRDARKAAGWTQVTLARICDVDPATIARVEQGRHKPGAHLRAQLGKALPSVRVALDEGALAERGGKDS